MTLTIYPVQASICDKAKQRLQMHRTDCSLSAPWDAALFQEVATNLFKSAQWDVLSQPCATPEAAAALEDLASLSLAMIYLRITQKRRNPAIQSLNALL